LVTTGGSLSSNAITNYVATITTGASHGLAVGDIVAVNSGSATDTPASVITAIPSATTFQYLTSTATLASTALTQGGWGKWPAAYTVPASTSTVLTNLVLTNPQTTGSASFTICAAGTPVIAGLPVAANASTVIDMKSYLPTVGQTIVVGSTTPSATATLSGKTIV
jgi:hypothetical protein